MHHFALQIWRKPMTIQECYQVLGGDYAQVKKRLPGIHLIRKFIAKFLDDGSYPELCRAMEQGQTADAIRSYLNSDDQA